jgi:hypothetical protein
MALSRTLKILMVCAISLNLGVMTSEAAPKKKALVIKISLPSGDTIVLRGSKTELFKRLQTESQKRNLLEKKLAECDPVDCEVLEEEYEDSKAAVEVITKSLYSKAADASLLSPITKSEFKFFASEVRFQINLVEKEIQELKNLTHPYLAGYLASFEKSYMFKGGYTRQTSVEAFMGGLTDQLRFYKKVLPGFERLSTAKNTEGIVEINISPRRSLEEIINSTEENMKSNLRL